MCALLRLALAVIVCAVVSGCAATTALEPQNRSLAASKARIYILRPGAWSGSAWGANVRINDREVGSVANNSYLSVDRPPGRYKLSVGFMGFVSNEHAFQAGAGRSYYFALNTKPTPVVAGGVVLMMPGTSLGRSVEEPSLAGLFKGTYLSELDANAGAAALTQLKAP